MRGTSALAAGLLVALAASPGAPASSASPGADTDAVASVVATYEERIPRLMAEQDVPGLAVALVDADGPLWVEGFGTTAGHGGRPVTADTPFNVQSMSKLVTATAVVRAAAAGRVDLDEPVTTYLPDFTVHSAFESHPERRITLRMLLSHTAGFTHEAPVGNNDDPEPGDFASHVRSIPDTWLRFPVGTGYAYSNLGIDLAGHVLEEVEGMPFADVVERELLGPLGMEHSTFDQSVIRSWDDRAVGHAEPYPSPLPLDVPMVAAGGLCTSAADLARFLGLQLDGRSSDGRLLLEPSWLEEMRTVPAPDEGAVAGYALGMSRTRWNRWPQRPDLYAHGGGGFGFLSDLWWLPGLGLGIAVLTNSQDHDLQGELALSILGDLLSAPGPYRDRLLAMPTRPAVVEPDGRSVPPADLADRVAAAAMPPAGDEAQRWAGWTGTYATTSWGVMDLGRPPERFLVERGVPWFDGMDDGADSPVHHRLVEVSPGVFLAGNGETLDLSGPVPRWRGLALTRVTGGPAPWQWGLLGAASSAALLWAGLAVRDGARRRRAPAAPVAPTSTARLGRRLADVLGIGTTGLLLSNVALLVVEPRLVDAGFLGWLEVAPALRAVLHLPLALCIVGGLAVTTVLVGWVLHWWSRAVRVRYAALALATLAVAAQLDAWSLVGWGFG